MAAFWLLCGFQGTEDGTVQLDTHRVWSEEKEVREENTLVFTCNQKSYNTGGTDWLDKHFLTKPWNHIINFSLNLLDLVPLCLYMSCKPFCAGRCTCKQHTKNWSLNWLYICMYGIWSVYAQVIKYGMWFLHAMIQWSQSPAVVLLAVVLRSFNTTPFWATHKRSGQCSPLNLPNKAKGGMHHLDLLLVPDLQ